MPLRCRSGLQVLVEKGEDVDAEWIPGPRRSSPAGSDHSHEIAIIPPRILRRSSGLIGVTSGRPTSLRNPNLQTRIAAGLGNRGSDGVNLGMEHVVVAQAGAGVDDAIVGLEEDVIEIDVVGIGLVGEVRVSVD